MVQVIAADELTANVASDASRPRTAGMSRCDDEIVVSRHISTLGLLARLALLVPTVDSLEYQAREV